MVEENSKVRCRSFFIILVIYFLVFLRPTCSRPAQPTAHLHWVTTLAPTTSRPRCAPREVPLRLLPCGPTHRSGVGVSVCGVSVCGVSVCASVNVIKYKSRCRIFSIDCSALFSTIILYIFYTLQKLHLVSPTFSCYTCVDTNFILLSG